VIHDPAEADPSQSSPLARRRARLRALPQPEPSAGLEAYRRERELALAWSPRRRENFERFLAASRREARPDYLPLKLDFENVSRCNFRCTMCMVSDWTKGKRAGDMPLEAFRRLIDEQYGLVEIKLQGVGEPLLQGDELFAMIRYARAQHIWVRTTTNASLLHLNDNARKLVDADPNEIQISVDGATKEVFEGIRRGAVFGRVVENCKLINGYCRERGVVRTKMWTVVQQANAHQLEALLDLAHETGFRHLTFSLELNDWGLDAWSRRNGAINVEDHLDPDALLGLIERGERLGIAVRFWNTTDKYSTASPATLCPWPFERAFVSSDLRVVPCCMIANPEVCQIGDPLGSFSDVWHGEAFAAFRQAHLDGRPPRVCRGCYSCRGGDDVA
jgi:pyrroloquinoline quinone biosynthesis protein E